MIKRMLPLLIGLSICSVALAQDPPVTKQSATTTTTQATTTTSAWSAMPPAGALSEEAIKTAIANDGYQEVKDLEFKNGVWRSEARGGNKQWVKIAVGPETGRVYVSGAPSKLNEDEVKAKLAAAGYEKVHDVEYEHGLWSADASTHHGTAVDLLVDPGDGSIVAKSRD